MENSTLTALIAAGSAVVVAGTLWVIKRQADTMDQQIALMKGSDAVAQKSAKAAEVSATAALRGMVLAGRSFEVFKESVAAAKATADAAKISADIAAGVSVPTLVIHEFETGDVGAADVRAFFQYPKVKISVKNYGNTPAFLKWWSLCFSCEDLPEVPIYDGPGDGMILDKIVLQPNETYTLPKLFYPHRQEFSLEDVEAIINRGKVFCAYGYICYGDIFGNTLRRLKFCETVLNIIPGYAAICDWHEGIGPRQYAGIDLFPIGKPKRIRQTNAY